MYKHNNTFLVDVNPSGGELWIRSRCLGIVAECFRINLQEMTIMSLFGETCSDAKVIIIVELNSLGILTQ